MSETFDLFYSDEALLSRVIFLSSPECISIFVEDEHKEYEYEEIFEKLLPPNIKISCIFPTGGKPKLEEAYELFGNSIEYGKTFFIADGDFDSALNNPMICASNFLYLKKYNIESYLLNKEAVIQFMRPKLKKTIKATEKIIGYDEWILNIDAFFKEIFKVHFLVQKYCPEIKNVSRGFAMFITKNGLPDYSKLQKYKEEISTYIPDIETKINEASAVLEECYGCEVGSYVCGKCLVGCLSRHVNSFIKKKLNDEEVKSFLVSNMECSNLHYIKDSLVEYLLN